MATKDDYVSDAYCVYIIAKKAARMGDLSENRSFLVAPPRFELGTQGSSGLCSTGLSYSAINNLLILPNRPQLDNPADKLL